jgi:molybdopterin molybdotransferase
MQAGRRGVTFDEALALVRDNAPVLRGARVPLEQLVGRILAEDVRARVDHPTFTNSSMDGFALRAADAAGLTPLRVVGESRAGAPFTGRIASGEATRVSTGAEIPEGADTVLRREDAGSADGWVTPQVAPPRGTAVRAAGEDVRRGQVLLSSGHVVAPHEVAVVAAAGHAEVLCRARPRVVIIGSGDEVVPPGWDLGAGQVYDANRPGIAAQARAAGAYVIATAVVPDDLEATVAAVRQALRGFDDDSDSAPDLLITTGGVSVGDHDHLRPALEAVGAREILFGVQIRPGHPLWLGRADDRLVLGLPGNPVSAAVCFHAFARPLLGRGDSWERRMPMATGYVKDTPRAELLRCREVGGSLEALPRQGSHAITSLAGASHLALIPAEHTSVEAGEQVNCCPLFGL